MTALRGGGRNVVLVACTLLIAGCAGTTGEARPSASPSSTHSASPSRTASSVDVGAMALADPTVWSTVFLTNNDVLFAHVTSLTADAITLSNVYTMTKTPSADPRLRSAGISIACTSPQQTVRAGAILYRQELNDGSRVADYLDATPCGPTVSRSTTPGRPPVPAAEPAWSVVFLSDNEVFFGHIRSNTAQGIDMVSVYYVQKDGTGAGGSTQLSVLGLTGSQIQCPTDELAISGASILYVEEMQENSFVVGRVDTLDKKPKLCFWPGSSSGWTDRRDHGHRVEILGAVAA